MSVGRGSLSAKTRVVRDAAEATVEAHPKWVEGRSREEAIADILGAIHAGVLMFVTNRGGEREKVDALKTGERERAIKELARMEYMPAIIALNSLKPEMGGAGRKT
jgi:hypothetical protein